MPKGTRICKVCGKEYEYCKTNRPTGVFRYQDVACSPEHGSIYFARILESRSVKPTADEVITTEQETADVVTDEDDEELDEEDELFEEEFDDDDEEELEVET